jgi:hypothetical protein
MVNTITQSLLSSLQAGGAASSAHDMLQIGLGLGLALAHSGAIGAAPSGTGAGAGTGTELPGSPSRTVAAPTRVAAAPDGVDAGSRFPAVSEQEARDAYAKNVEGAEPARRPDYTSALGATGGVRRSRHLRLAGLIPHLHPTRPRPLFVTDDAMQVRFAEPVGQPRATVAFNDKTAIDHGSEERQLERSKAEIVRPLSSIERSTGVTVAPLPTGASPPAPLPHTVTPTRVGLGLVLVVSPHPPSSFPHPPCSETPDFAVKEGLGGLPLNAEEGARAAVPVLVYPELSTVSGQTEGYKTHPVAGIAPPPPPVGNLTFTALPLPSSFYMAVVETHVASQEVDYLPQVPPFAPLHRRAPCCHTVSNTRRLLRCAAAPPDASPDACPPRPS